MHLTKSKLQQIITEELSKLLEGDVVQGDFSQAAKDRKNQSVKDAKEKLSGLIYNMLLDHNKLESDMSYYRPRFDAAIKILKLSKDDINIQVDEIARVNAKQPFVNKVKNFINKNLLRQG